MRLSASIANKLWKMIEEGAAVPSSSLKDAIVEKMVDDGVLHKLQSGRTKALLYIKDKAAINAYLLNHFGISDLADYIEKLASAELTRSESVVVSGNSKLKNIRTFKGFLVNSYLTVEGTLNRKPFVVQPAEGSFTFIYDYENFAPNTTVTIVGIENPENFRKIANQQYLFKDIQPLFVSRYPQSNDLVKWLQTVPNHYLHFGDLDFAGMQIYLNEYKRHLGEKASFLIPGNAEELLQKFGNRDLYYKQLHLANNSFNEKGMEALVKLFHKYKKVLEQEVFIQVEK
jgi:hypothetical protein